MKGSHISIGGHSNATEPKTSPRSIKTPNHPGRRLVSNPPSAHLLSKKESTKPKGTENATIEELDQMLEDDALVLLNMKKDITNSQKDELLKLKESVLTIKKEYDVIHVANNAKEVQLKALEDKFQTLNNVEQATISTCADVDEQRRSLEDQAAIVLEEYEAEQRTIKMITHMLKRLDKEISQCRMDTAKAVVLVDHAKHDVAITEVSLQASRQEVADQEAQLEKLNSTLKARKDQREEKINMLHGLSQEGENSVARLQNSMSEHTRVCTHYSMSRLYILGLNIAILIYFPMYHAYSHRGWNPAADSACGPPWPPATTRHGRTRRRRTSSLTSPTLRAARD